MHYGTNPTAKSPNRRNPALPSMAFRVHMARLKPERTYYSARASAEKTRIPILTFADYFISNERHHAELA